MGCGGHGEVKQNGVVNLRGKCRNGRSYCKCKAGFGDGVVVMERCGVKM